MVKPYSNIFLTGFILVLFSMIFGCLWSDEKVLTSSTGNTGDIVVVMDSSTWAGEAGLQVKKCLSAPQEGLPQSEALFNLIEVTPKNFTQIFKMTRNIVVIEKDASAEKASYVLKEDLWAKNQLVLILKADNTENLAEIISGNCEGITNRFREEEWKRLQFAFEKLKSAEKMKMIQDRLGINPIIPNDYVLAKDEKDLVWLRKDFEKEGHQVSMGILMYKSPYDSVGALERENIIAERNMRCKVVEGPTEGSYMSTYSEFAPIERELGFEEKYVKEFRGLWNMQGAFMGGPFVHYSFIDKTGKYLIDIDAYVFAPKFDKREYLRELEAIALSAMK